MNSAANGFQVFSDFKPDNPGLGKDWRKKLKILKMVGSMTLKCVKQNISAIGLSRDPAKGQALLVFV